MQSRNEWLKHTLIGIIMGLLVVAILILPLPYDVIGVGSAQQVKSAIWVKDHPAKQQGDFLFTTVAVREATLFDAIWCLFSSEMELVKREQLRQDQESPFDYEMRQREEMLQSQNTAIIAAFRQLQRPLQIQTQGVKVIGFAKEHITGLQVGDRIYQVDKRPIHSSESLLRFFQQKEKGEQVTVHFERARKRFSRQVRLVALSSQQVGLGIIPQNQIQVETKPPIRFTTGSVSGPSAGLMFSLEIVNRLRSKSLTGGLRIAGTGTINEQGKVGQIGGIKYKIISAAKENATYFFCPKDQSSTDQNEREALETIRKLGLVIHIIPVASLNEAVEYLDRLTRAGHLAYNDSVLVI